MVGAAINPGPYKFLTHGLIQGPQLNAMSESETFNFPPQLTMTRKDHCARIAFKNLRIKVPPNYLGSWERGKGMREAGIWQSKRHDFPQVSLPFSREWISDPLVKLLLGSFLAEVTAHFED